MSGPRGRVWFNNRTWADRLQAQEPVRPDPRFPDRPRSGFFDLLSRIARAYDSMIDDPNADSNDVVPEMMQLVGANPDDVSYVARTRLHMAIRRINRPELLKPHLMTFFIGGWHDGFMAGALYGNQNPTVGHVTLEQEGERDGESD